MEVVILDGSLREKLAENGGKILRALEENSEASLSFEGDELHVEGSGWSEWVCLQVLEAISLGFDEKKAFKLFEDDYFLEVLDLQNIFRKSKKLIERYKARVIGSQGKAKKKLEELSGAFISISEDSIALIGKFEELQSAREAITRLFEGSPHEAVYRFLEKRNFTLKKNELRF